MSAKAQCPRCGVLMCNIHMTRNEHYSKTKFICSRCDGEISFEVLARKERQERERRREEEKRRQEEERLRPERERQAKEVQR